MRTDELISVREYLTITTDYSPDCDYEQIFRVPPFICIEVLSPEDRLSKVREKLDDYLHFGVPYIFLLDPCARKAHRWTAQGMLEVTELRTENPETVVPLEALFE